jgi:hypothetical protein
LIEVGIERLDRLIDGGARLIELGIDRLGTVSDSGARRIELSRGGTVWMDSEGSDNERIDKEGSRVGIDTDESALRTPPIPMLEMRVGTDRNPDELIDEGDGIVIEGIVTLGITAMSSEAVHVVDDKPPISTRLQLPYSARTSSG